MKTKETQLSSVRNLSLECCKLIAACFVVFLHVPFPGRFGGLVNCLARFAVPLFFAVSGWFSFGVSSGKLVKRLKHILLLEVSADGLYLTWQCFRGILSGESLLQCLLRQMPNRQDLISWLLLNVDPFAGHLWYLSASVLCYGVLWTYLRLRENRRGYGPLYLSGFLLLAGCFAMGEFSRFTGLQVDYRVYRSGLFMGLPMFFMGLLFREYRRKLSSVSVSLLTAGLLLSMLEWYCIGGHDLYIGSVLMAGSLLLVTDAHPSVPERLKKTAAKAGSVSTFVYLVHLLLMDGYELFFRQKAVMLMGNAEPWLYPLIILTAAVMAGFLWEWVCNLRQKKIF